MVSWKPNKPKDVPTDVPYRHLGNPKSYKRGTVSKVTFTLNPKTNAKLKVD